MKNWWTTGSNRMYGLIIFSSDNSPAKSDQGAYSREFYKGVGILKGGKTTLDEGGIRVPMIAYWPGVTQAGEVSNQVSYFPDILPTLAEVESNSTDSKIF